MTKTLSRSGTKVAFGDVVRLSRARSNDPEADGFERFIGLEHIDPGDLRVRRWGDIIDGVTFTNVFRPGQVLFGKRRAYQRKVAVADFSGVCSSDIYVLEPSDGSLLPELLPFICQTDAFFEHAVGTSAGSLSPRTNWDSLASFMFALPAVDEQRRLVSLLEALDRSSESLRTLVSSMEAAAIARLDQALKSDPHESRRVSVASLLREPPKNGLSPKASSEQGRFQTVSISAITGGRFEPSGNTKPVDLTIDEAAPYLVEAGDIFAVRGNGNKLLTGKAGIVCGEYRDLIYPDLLIRLRFDEARIHPRFALAQWNHPVVHGRLLTRAKSSNGIWKINGQDVRAHELVVPPIERQCAIVSQLSDFESGIAAVMARRVATQHMKRAIMAQVWGECNE